MFLVPHICRLDKIDLKNIIKNKNKSIIVNLLSGTSMTFNKVLGTEHSKGIPKREVTHPTNVFNNQSLDSVPHELVWTFSAEN